VDAVERRLLLLLPDKLERFAHRPLVEDLLARGVAVAVDPPATPYRRIARIPDAISVTVSLKQARRLRKRLPHDPSAITIFDPAQYPLARGLLALLPECELWYEHSAELPRGDRRLSELHALAAERARVRFTAVDPQPLHEALGRLD
jgi:hypothetical protein